MDQLGTSSRCFTEVTPEAAIHFQVVDLGRQIYVWIGVGTAKLGELYFAIKSAAVRLGAGSGMHLQ